MEHLVNDYEKADFLQNTLIGVATQDGCGGTELDYINLRKYFLDNSLTKDLLPAWVRTNRNTDEFWQFIKNKFRTYAERRMFIREEMNNLLEFCESQQTLPAEKTISEIILKINNSSLNEAWQKALKRKMSDPDGAITMSRTILESICKYILEENNIKYDDKIELPELYKKTSSALNLAPSQHTEEIFRQILGGCSAIVNGLGSLRNKMGDAHGRGKGNIKPAPRHAELAVNLSGAMALFLLETFNAKKS